MTTQLNKSSDPNNKKQISKITVESFTDELL